MNPTNEPSSATPTAVGTPRMLPDPGVRDPLRTTLRALQQGVAALIPDGTVL